MVVKIEHDSSRGRFFVRLQGGEEAWLGYRRDGSELEFYHVFVPPEHRGKAYAGRILIEGFEYAKREGCTVRVTCPYIASRFLPRFPRYQELVKQ